jgi:anti-sigma factor RsiW
MNDCGENTAGGEHTARGHEHCHDLLSSLSEYVDGSLQEELCQEIERHLHECSKCRVVVNTLKKTVELYHDTAEDASIPDEVRQRLFVRLELKDFIIKKE